MLPPPFSQDPRCWSPVFDVIVTPIHDMVGMGAKSSSVAPWRWLEMGRRGRMIGCVGSLHDVLLQSQVFFRNYCSFAF